MVIIHFGSFSNASKYNGIRVVLPKHILYQSQKHKVCFVNLAHDTIDEINTQFIYQEYKNDLGKLPKPFDKPDLVIFNGVYFPQYLQISSYYSKNGIPYVICPHGSLTAGGQKIKRIKKYFANVFCFNRFIKNAASIHFLSQQEKDDSKKFKVNNCFVAANGIEVRDLQLTKRDYKNKNFIYIGRLAIFHKGLDLLLEGLSLIKDEFKSKGCHLTIYGPGEENDIQFLKTMISKNGLQDVVTLCGPVYDRQKEELLIASDVFIQTSRMEGLPMGILEALSFGIPVLVTRGTNLFDAILNYNCGWVCENDSNEIARLILKCIDSDDNFIRKENALKCAKNEYSWSFVTNKILMNYSQIIGEKNDT